MLSYGIMPFWRRYEQPTPTGPQWDERAWEQQLAQDRNNARELAFYQAAKNKHDAYMMRFNPRERAALQRTGLWRKPDDEAAVEGVMRHMLVGEY